MEGSGRTHCYTKEVDVPIVTRSTPKMGMHYKIIMAHVCMLFSEAVVKWSKLLLITRHGSPEGQ
jgi:hypothetical protein